MFTSVRTQNKYKYFIVIASNGVGHPVSTDILLDHNIDDKGMLILTFENNEHVVHRKWNSIDYGYNKPQ